MPGCLHLRELHLVVGVQQLEVVGGALGGDDDAPPTACFHKRTGKVLTLMRSCDRSNLKCNI